MKPEIKQRIEKLNNGELPEGYNKTDFGFFPCDWVTDKTFGDLFDFFGGLSKSRDELGEEGSAYLHYGDLHRDSSNIVSIYQYEQLPKCDISLTGKEKYLMKDGDVAFLDASEDLEGTSRAVLIDNPENKPFIAGLHILYGKAKNDSLNKWFKQYITSSKSVKKQFQRLAVGFKVYGVNRDAISRIQVAYPSSSQEQSRIAEILMKWDEAIELYDKQIDALTRFKAVCLKKMFPAKGQSVPEWRFHGFTDAWEQYKLGDVLSLLKDGTHGTHQNSDNGVYLLSAKNIKNGQIVIDEETDRKISIEEYETIHSNFKLKVDDVLLTIVGSIGETAILKNPEIATFQRSVAFLRPNENTVSIFLKTEIDTDLFQKELADRKSQSAQPGVYLGELEKIPFYITSIQEQQKIGIFFSNLDRLITLHQRKKEEITNQRKALQQYLLNGIVRVKT